MSEGDGGGGNDSVYGNAGGCPAGGDGVASISPQTEQHQRNKTRAQIKHEQKKHSAANSKLYNQQYNLAKKDRKFLNLETQYSRLENLLSLLATIQFCLSLILLLLFTVSLAGAGGIVAPTNGFFLSGFSAVTEVLAFVGSGVLYLFGMPPTMNGEPKVNFNTNAGQPVPPEMVSKRPNTLLLVTAVSVIPMICAAAVPLTLLVFLVLSGSNPVTAPLMLGLIISLAIFLIISAAHAYVKNKHMQTGYELNCMLAAQYEIATNELAPEQAIVLGIQQKGYQALGPTPKNLMEKTNPAQSDNRWSFIKMIPKF